MHRFSYSGRRPRLRLYRIGKADAKKLLAKGWYLLPGQQAFELVSPKGFAEYWLARDAAEELIKAARGGRKKRRKKE